MPCYSPLRLLRTQNLNLETGKFHFEFLGKATTFETNDDLYLVPCNRCIGCRLDYARQWSNRMVLELADNVRAVFVTLTYDNDHVPHGHDPVTGVENEYLSLNVRDTQLFWKRLRKHFSERKIRYWLAGEYGSRTHRPHYHAIIYGLSLADFDDFAFYKYNKLNQPLFTSKSLESIWRCGYVTIGSVTRDSCAYTARYMLKKAKGYDKLEYTSMGIVPQFSTMSRRPGIGLSYLENHPNFSSVVSVFDGTDVVSFPLPKRLFDKLLDIDPDKYYEIKEMRRNSQIYRISEELKRTDLEYLDYLDLKESEMYRTIKGINADTRLDI